MNIKNLTFFRVLSAIIMVIMTINIGVAQEDEEDEDDGESQWESKLQLGGSYYSGNVNQRDFRSKGNFARKDSIVEYSLFYKVVVGKTMEDDEDEWKDKNQLYSGGIKLDYKPESTFSPFIVFEAYKNLPKKIDLRLTALAGLKWLYYSTEKSAFSISAAALYESEKYTEKDDDGIDKEDDFRISIRPKFKQQIGENIFFEHETYFKFTGNETSDFTIESATALSSKLTKKLNLELSYEVVHESKAFGDVAPTDHAFVASLVFKF